VFAVPSQPFAHISVLTPPQQIFCCFLTNVPNCARCAPAPYSVAHLQMFFNPHAPILTFACLSFFFTTVWAVPPRTRDDDFHFVARFFTLFPNVFFGTLRRHLLVLLSDFYPCAPSFAEASRFPSPSGDRHVPAFPIFFRKSPCPRNPPPPPRCHRYFYHCF